MSTDPITGTAQDIGTLAIQITANDPVSYTHLEEEIYVPFAAISGMVLDDSFSNVKVTNGKVISDGKNNIVQHQCRLEHSVSNITEKYLESSIFVLSSRYEGLDRKSTRLNSSHSRASRMPSSA